MGDIHRVLGPTFLPTISPDRRRWSVGYLLSCGGFASSDRTRIVESPARRLRVGAHRREIFAAPRDDPTDWQLAVETNTPTCPRFGASVLR
jgi:hypothetical protein